MLITGEHWPRQTALKACDRSFQRTAASGSPVVGRTGVHSEVAMGLGTVRIGLVRKRDTLAGSVRVSHCKWSMQGM